MKIRIRAKEWAVSLLILHLICATLACVHRRMIYSSLIWFHSRKGLSRDETRVHDYVKNFTHQIFASVPVEDRPEIKIMPPVTTPPCQSSEEDGNLPDKGRGSNIAHREVWFQFYRYRRPCGEQMGDRLIVFEYDAFIGLPNAGQLIIDKVKNLTTEVHYLGYCYRNSQNHPRIIGRAPYCLHAYVLSLSAAKLLLDDMDACGAYADVQVANLCNNKNVSWSFDTTDYDTRFVDEYNMRDGVHISGPFLYGGFMLQSKFDHFLEGERIEGQAFHLGRAIYVFMNQTWRYVPDMDTLESLGLSHTHRRPIPVSPWQMSLFPMGEALKPVGG